MYLCVLVYMHKGISGALLYQLFFRLIYLRQNLSGSRAGLVPSKPQWSCLPSDLLG